jgi:hypothetical protein
MEKIRRDSGLIIKEELFTHVKGNIAFSKLVSIIKFI